MSSTPILKRFTSATGVTASGLSFPLALTVGGAGAQTKTIMAIPGRMSARTRFTGGLDTVNSVWRDSGVTWDGTTLSEQNPVFAIAGGYTASAAFSQSGGNLIANYTTSGALSNQSAKVNIDGTLYFP